MEQWLTKVQRNDIYRLIEESGLDPAECDLTETYDPGVPVSARQRRSRKDRGRHGQSVYTGGRGDVAELKHLPSGSVFVIERRRPPHMLRYESVVAGRTQSSGWDWDNAVTDLSKWAKIVKRECVDPDLWAELRRGRELFTKTQREGFANNPFTREEQAEVAEQLKTIKEYVKKTYSLSVEQAARVEARFDEAEDASRRLGRKDWLLMFGGALFSLLLSAVIPLEAVQYTFATIAHGLGHLFGGQTSHQLPPTP